MSSVAQNKTWYCLLHFTQIGEARLHAEGGKSPSYERVYGVCTQKQQCEDGQKQGNICCNPERYIAPLRYASLTFQNISAVKKSCSWGQIWLLIPVTSLAGWVFAMSLGAVSVGSTINALPASWGHSSSKGELFVSPALSLSCQDWQSEKSSPFR